MPFTRYVVTLTNKVYQINLVTGCTITSPLVEDGTFRDTPPVVVGGAAAFDSVQNISIAVAGGTTQTVTGPGDFIVAPSSVIQDDRFTHVDPRPYEFPLALLVFTTSDGITTYDCFFRLAEVQGVFNAPPQGWTPTESQ